MARLSDLPAEVLLAIADYLQMTTKQAPLLDFYERGEAYRYTIDQRPSPSVKDLQSFLLATYRMNGLLLQSMFYRDILVSRDENNPSRLQQLNWTLEKNPSLQEHIISATMSCHGSIHDINLLFWSTNIQALTILDFNDDGSQEWEDNSHIGTSPIKCLRLIDCQATKENLTTVLSWPAALKTLHYDADWDGHYGDDPADNWTCAALVHALQPQKKTLVELTMTRPMLQYGGLGLCPRIDLSEFTSLKTLRIYYVFLRGCDKRHGIWKGLPNSLGVLEVFYDDERISAFFSDTDESPDPFILDLIPHKRAHLPRLHTVNVYTPETFDDAETGMLVSGVPWVLPSLLAREAESASVKLNELWYGKSPLEGKYSALP
ncbi:unnamed protein product [Penicillium glandicola]